MVKSRIAMAGLAAVTAVAALVGGGPVVASAGVPAAGTGIAGTAAAGTAAQAGRYRNPVIDRDFPDPDVIRTNDGSYYAYSTESDIGSRHLNIQVERSRDLVHWRFLGDALPSLPSWGNKTVVSWAPQVVHARGRYYLYYSIVPNRLADDFGLCLAVATSSRPAGPFHPTAKPLYCGPTYADIDPDVFRDPATGHWLVYWGSGGDIVTARLADSMTQLARPNAEPTRLLRGWSAYIHRPYEHGIEGPFVIARHGWYYLFYSGNNCCSYPPHYATMVARSRHATGPYQRLAATRPGLSSVMLHSNDRWVGPGHNSVIRDQAGHDWIVFHAIDTRNPFLPGSDSAVRRPMLIDRLHYVDGWPVVGGGTPSTGLRAAPSTG